MLTVRDWKTVPAPNASFGGGRESLHGPFFVKEAVLRFAVAGGCPAPLRFRLGLSHKTNNKIK